MGLHIPYGTQAVILSRYESGRVKTDAYVLEDKIIVRERITDKKRPSRKSVALSDDDMRALVSIWMDRRGTTGKGEAQ